MSVLTSIKRTVLYSQKYGGSLTEKELFERLISNKVYSKEEINKWINLSVFQKPPFDKRKTFLKEKIKKAEELTKLIKKRFKNILFLGISGSVAAGYPKEKDDIDIIIITKSNKLWITRFKLRLFVLFNKIPHRRFEKKEKKDEFCFNLWLDEKSLKIKTGKQNLKNAIDLILIKPLLNKNQTYEKFIMANDWAKKYTATGYNEKIKKIKIKKNNLREREDLIDKITNWLMFWPQFFYMKKRIKNEQIGLHEAFFHH